MTFIEHDQPIFLLFILFLCALVGLLSQKRPFFAIISSVFVTMFAAATLSNFGIIPHQAQIYDFVWEYFISVSIPFILFRADFYIIKTRSGPTLKAFLIGAVGAVLGSIVAYYLVSVGAETWKIVSMFCATYIGGSINYVAVSQTLDLQDTDLFFAGTAADNMTMAVYFAVLGTMGSSAKIIKYFSSKDTPKEVHIPLLPDRALDLVDLTAAFVLSLGFLTISIFIRDYLNMKGFDILAVTALTLLFVNFFPRQSQKFIPTEKVGFMMLQVFFAVIGASANVKLAISEAPKIILITGTIVLIHWIFTLSMGKYFKLGLREMIIASNANIGGPATAAAMATSREWHDLVVPGILCGTLGYAIATFIGTTLGHCLVWSSGG